MTSAVRAAANVAALLDPTDPLGLLARQRLARAARHQELQMSEAVMIGTPARDAAVDPHPDDFPGVPNAGLPGHDGNPHGPNVRCIEVDSLEWQRLVDERREMDRG